MLMCLTTNTALARVVVLLGTVDTLIKQIKDSKSKILFQNALLVCCSLVCAVLLHGSASG